jgi:hypothetical protein
MILANQRRGRVEQKAAFRLKKAETLIGLGHKLELFCCVLLSLISGDLRI